MRLKVFAPMLTLLTFMVLGFFYTINFLNVQESKGVVINLAGRQRMLTQKMSKEAFSPLEKQNHFNNLKKTADLFNSTLSGLIDGDRKLNLPPIENEKIKNQLLKVKKLWEPFSKAVYTLSNTTDNMKIEEAKKFIAANNIPLLKEMNKVVKMMEVENTTSVASLKIMFVIILGLMCAIVVFSLINVNSNIFKPMDTVMQSAIRIGKIRNLAYEKNSKENLITEIKNNKLFSEFANAINSILTKIQMQSEMLNNLPTPVLAMDTDFNITYINKIGANLIGKDQATLTGLKCYDQMKTDDCQTERCACSIAMREDKLVSSETIANPGNNKDLPIYYTGKTTRDNEGNVIGAVEFVADLTPTKEKEKYLDESTKRLHKVMEQVSHGDMTVYLEPEGKSEIVDSLFNSMNQMVLNIKQIIQQVAEAVDSTMSVSTQIAASVEEMSAGAEELNNQTHAIATSIDEMTKTIIETTQNTSSAASSARDAGTIADEGGRVVNKAVNGMETISNVVSHAAEKIIELGNNSDKIGEIIEVINEIAEQTNLLALNAAIEAARAGEHGRGFAVVADEVRKLSERTSSATKEIADMVQEIQSYTKQAVSSINEGTEEVREGKDLAQKAGEAISNIVEKTNIVVDEISQVATASEEQSSTSEQVSQNIVMINNVSSETLIGIQQVATATYELNQMTENLQEILKQFKMDSQSATNYPLTEFAEQKNEVMV